MERRISNNWRDIHLSENFKLGEFVVSESFPELAAKIVPTVDQINNLYHLCQFALQPIRNEFGEVKISSGLRDVDLNNALGGVNDSQHLFGEAADLTVVNFPSLDVYAFCMHDLKWVGELILYKKKGHLHISTKCLWNKADQIIKEG